MPNEGRCNEVALPDPLGRKIASRRKAAMHLMSTRFFQLYRNVEKEAKASK